MRRSREKNNLILLLVILFVLTVGIGYAVLTEQLTINNTISYDSMKWDVGFTAAEDGYDSLVDTIVYWYENMYGPLEDVGVTDEELVETIFSLMYGDPEPFSIAKSTASISADKKSITVNCDLNMTSKSQLCSTKVTIKNSGSLVAAFDDYSAYLNLPDDMGQISMYWLNHEMYGILSEVYEGQTIAPNESVELVIFIATNELTEDVLPLEKGSVPVTITLDFEEAPVDVSQLNMVVPYETESYFWLGHDSAVKNIIIEDEINPPEDYDFSMDISALHKGKVMAYFVHAERNPYGSYYYDMYIQSDGKLYANFDMSSWFGGFYNVETITGLELMDTTYMVKSDHMFSGIGQMTDNFSATITIRNPNALSYSSMFYYAAINNNSVFTVNYTSETSDLVDEMIATKSSNSNVVKGVQVN